MKVKDSDTKINLMEEGDGMTDSNRAPNRLINEKSPYLLQHAYNPVDWYPWSEEAFEKANAEDKPIFLSIGYSTCHWCHVMERESFEDEEIAQLLNEGFVAIKVDREERPDIDTVYLNACQALTGHGGWPLTIIMTPEQKPFYAATYIPKYSKGYITGLMELLPSLSEVWKSKRKDALEAADNITKALNKHNRVEAGEIFDEKVVRETFKILYNNFDRTYGGFGGEPKFPSPHNLMFLINYYKIYGEKAALDMVEQTLSSMYKGGIFDHIGYGFSRYSVDRKWLVPHFEKMLYDNAMLCMVYAEAYAVTKNQLFKEVAENIIEYMFRDMRYKEGGFYCAEDADSEGIEGKFYLWTVEEVRKVLGEEEGERFCKLYDISEKGNFEGKNIPNLISVNLEDIKNKEVIENQIKELFSYREGRVHPHKDDKILVSWNGLMIASLARCGNIFKNHHYIDKAEETVDFILNNMIRQDGRLMSRYRDKDVDYLGYLEDYAFFTWGLIELYEATSRPRYMDKVMGLIKETRHLFGDEENSGFFIYGKDAEKLILRPKDIYDGAIPSGNSVTLYNLIRLYSKTGDTDIKEDIEKMLKAFSNEVKESPMAYTFFITAYMNYITNK